VTLPIVIVISLAGVTTAAIIFGRPLSLSYKGLRAVVDQTAQHTREIKETVGEANGEGPLMDIVERLVAGQASLNQGQALLSQRLDEQTHVMRHGSDEPESLNHYTQSRMHDVLSAVAVVSLKVDAIWGHLAHGYPLPDLPSMKNPKETES
jgi:hypothetical protein